MRFFLKFAGLHVLGCAAESIFGTIIYLIARGGFQILVLKNIGPIIVACLTLIALQAQYLRPVFAMLTVVLARRITVKMSYIYFLMQLLSALFFMLMYKLSAHDEFQFFGSPGDGYSQATYLFGVTILFSTLSLAFFRQRKAEPNTKAKPNTSGLDS